MARSVERWDAGRVPVQDGRTVVITGANTGVGFETAKVLADRGATIVLACRDQARAQRAAAAVDGAVETLPLDLASLRSVRAAAAELRSRHARIDVLINNAGVMRTPEARTEDGFELQLGTNHLGHMAFTGLVLDLLLPVAGSRVVTVSSPAHRQGTIDVDDLSSGPRYRPAAAYARSKLANLLFAFELQRRLAATGAATISLAAHPGSARTELNRHLPRLFRGRSWGLARPITQPAAKGALSILRAAVDADAAGHDYFGPDGPMEFVGWPTRLEPTAVARDPEVARRLWEASEEMTGVRFTALSADARGAPDVRGTGRVGWRGGTRPGRRST